MLEMALGLSMGILLAFVVARFALHWVVPSYGTLIILLVMAVCLVVSVICLVLLLRRASRPDDARMARHVARAALGLLVGFAVVLVVPAGTAMSHPLDPATTDILVITTSDNGFVRASTTIEAISDGKTQTYRIGSELLSPYAWAYEPYSYGDLARWFARPCDLGRITYSMSFADGKPTLRARYGVPYDEQGNTVPSVVLAIARALRDRHMEAKTIEVTHLYGDVYAASSWETGSFLVTARDGEKPDFSPVDVRLGSNTLFDGFIRNDLASRPLSDEGSEIEVPVAP